MPDFDIYDPQDREALYMILQRNGRRRIEVTLDNIKAVQDKAEKEARDLDLALDDYLRKGQI